MTLMHRMLRHRRLVPQAAMLLVVLDVINNKMNSRKSQESFCFLVKAEDNSQLYLVIAD